MGDHYYGIAPGGRAEGRNLEVELISGEDLGEWQHRIHVPPFLPTYVTVEEILAWGGVNREADWDKEIVRERKARDMRGKGLGLISHFVKALIARDVPIRAGEKVDRLDVADGRVTGVIMSSGEKISARAGVVLATGGYEANPALVDAFEKMPNWMNICPVSTTGDGLLMGNAAGGATHFIRNNMELFLGFEIPPGEANPEPQFNIVGIVELFSPHTMVVNDRGERFGDESYFQKLIPGLRHFDPMRHRYANLPCFMIFDQQYASKFSFANVPAGAGIPDWVSRDDTIEGLAGKLGIDLAGLTKTIDRFNGFAGTGIDEDFHRGEIAWRLDAKSERDGPNPSLGPISKGPFYGIELRPCGSTSAGLLTNTHAQVLDNGRNAIPGLYAAGNTAARVEFGTGYQAGFTLSSGMTFGYLAAQHMRASSEVRT
jgi:3-oxosteroid 1-dehydrogenase